MDDELNELRLEFLGEARGKAGEMAALLEGDAGSDALDRLAYLAHQLKGSGGSYGFPRISEAAAAVERAIEAMAAGHAAAGGEVRACLGELAEAIEAGVRRLTGA